MRVSPSRIDALKSWIDLVAGRVAVCCEWARRDGRLGRAGRFWRSGSRETVCCTLFGCVSACEIGGVSNASRAEWHTCPARASGGSLIDMENETMNQNLATLNLSDAQLNAIDSALTELETQLGLVALTSSSKLRAAKLGEKSESFCRQALQMLSENPQIIPPNLNVAEAVADLAARDRLRPRLIRLSRLLARGNDTDFALGSDAMAVAVQGYGLLKLVGRSEGLEPMRKALGSRFSKSRRSAAEEKKVA